MVTAKRISDGFYDECLVVGEVPQGSQMIRVSLVKKGSTVGLDIRKFKKDKDGTPTKGILINSSETTKGLQEVFTSSEVIQKFVDTGEVTFEDYNKEEDN